MNLIEKGFFKLAGIKPEGEDLKWYSIAGFSLLAKIDQLKNKSSFEGDPLPEEGPALVIANHREKPVFFIRGYRVGEINHRIIRVFAKHTLFDYHAEEAKEVRERTGKSSDLLNVTPQSPWWHRKAADILAAGIKGLGANPVVRGGSDADGLDFLDKGAAEFKIKHIVGIFGQESRSRTLANPMPGPGVLATENSEVPIYALAMCDKRISVRRLGTYEELWDDPKTHKLAEKNLMVLIFDAIADMSDPEIKNDWYQNQRPKLLPERTEEKALEPVLTC